jgi:hypothetical protein
MGLLAGEATDVAAGIDTSDLSRFPSLIAGFALFEPRPTEIATRIDFHNHMERVETHES